MIHMTRTTIATTLGWFLVLMLLPLSAAIGSGASIVAMLAALLFAPFVLNREAASAIWQQPAMVIFIAAPLVLAAAFAVTAQAPADVRYAANFLSLPLAAIVYLVARRVNLPNVTMTLAILCLAGALVAAIISVYDVFVLHKVRFIGHYMGPNVLARLALLMGFIGMIGIFVTRSRWRYMLYLGPFAALLTIYLSGTRGALVIFPALAAIYGVFLVTDRTERNPVHALLCAAVLAFALFTLTSDRMASIGWIAGNLAAGADSGDNATSVRLAFLSGAWELFQGAPLLGFGWANFARVAIPVVGVELIGSPDNWIFQFHNDLANFAVAAGIVGIALLAALVLAPLLGVWRMPRDGAFRLRLYCCLTLSAWVGISGLTDLTLGYDLPTTLYAFLTAIVLGAPLTQGRDG
ncbi:MAG TPA: O-antigen ligase family protein [Devosia sp.]|nr:O-antigen ligase family protein [Devosia sp.]